MNQSKNTHPLPAGTVLLEASGLGLQQDDRWLFRKLELSLTSGEFLALSGPSGVGKTSLLHALAGLRAPTEGKVIPFPGTDSGEIDRGDRRVGIIFQDLLLTPNASLLQNVSRV